MRPFVHRTGRTGVGAQPAESFPVPGSDGDPGRLGIPGVSGVPRAQEWDAVESTHAPDLQGDEVHFVALDDGDQTVVVDEDEPDGSVAPLADAVEKLLDPPYRALALRQSDDVWSVAATRTATVELPADIIGDAIELTSVEGRRELRVDGNPSDLELPALEELGAQLESDYALLAERFTDTIWVVDADAL